ncbi:MAG TPA: ABC transporter ATP-binding protein, partial [Actinomycetes bacterium]|nr:ABC transporter ATP-binding protein [Actinomycetes bacterium]
MAAISVQGLTKRFGDVLAVDQLDFGVDPGTVTGFLGPNGAGKTTTLRMLLGLVAPTSGTATIGGRPYRELADPARRVGAVLEASGFHPGRTARDHLRVLATAAGVAPGRVDEVLEQTGLAAAGRRRVGGFSLGMRQRLGLAAALLGDPEVLVLDEPANGLDPEGVRWLRGLVRGLADQGRTVLVSSHALAEVAQTVDQVVIIDRGRLVAQSTLAALTAGADRTVRVRTPQPEALRDLLVARGARATLDGPDRLVVAGAS